MNHHERQSVFISRRAFTLVELLVSIAIVVIVAAITLPFIGAILDLARGGSGVNTVHVAVTAARAYATLDRSAPFAAISDPAYVGGEYSGTAVIFTPANEMRLVENVADARDGGFNYLEPNRNGYNDIEQRDYINLPSDQAVVGIARVSFNAAVLLAPPFAIRFDQNGQLIASQGSDDAKVVYYNGDYGPTYQVSSDRGNYAPAPYNPDDWDPQYATVQTNNLTRAGSLIRKRYHLPFEKLETVIGVVVYSRTDFRNAAPGGSPLNLDSTGPSDSINAAASNWILENGTPLFFSRMSGAMLRER